MMWDFYIANARYLSPIGGNAEYNVLIFPAVGEPTSIIHMPTFLDGWAAAQNWVSDIRPRTKTWADSVANRIKELKLERGKIGMDGLAGPLDPDGWLPHDVYKRPAAAALSWPQDAATAKPCLSACYCDANSLHTGISKGDVT